MKTNNLSVKKLTKNLILRALRQLYAASEIIILIRWVMPPTKVENLLFEFFFSSEIPQSFKFFNFAKSSLFPSFFFIGYIYIYVSLSPLQHSLIAISSSCFFCKVNVIGPFPLYAILNPICSQILHVRFYFETRSKSSLCPCQLKNLRTKL